MSNKDEEKSTPKFMNKPSKILIKPLSKVTSWRLMIAFTLNGKFKNLYDLS